MSVTPLRTDGWRGPGCTNACLPRLHDPESHERYGYQRAVEDAWPKVVRTGPLTVDLARRTAAIDGRELALTGREWSLLRELASRLGAIVSREEIAAEALGSPLYNAHAIRVYISRLRAKLGTGAGLVETRRTKYRLLAVAPGDPAPPYVGAPFGGPLPPGRWAWEHDRCVCCGTTERRHRQGGRCDACRYHKRHAQAGTCPFRGEGEPS